MQQLTVASRKMLLVCQHLEALLISANNFRRMSSKVEGMMYVLQVFLYWRRNLTEKMEVFSLSIV